MSVPRVTISEAKARFDVATLWRVLDLPGKPGRSCCCPLHQDRSASFSVFVGTNGSLRWKCHAGCGDGGPVELLARALGLDEREACRRIVELASEGSANLPCAQAPLRKHRTPPVRHLVVPVGMARGSEDELRALAKLRHLSVQGLELASARGLLWFAPGRGFASWLVTDSRRTNAQSRKMDGTTWEHIGFKKAWTLPGSRATWPIGAPEAAVYPFIALVEGGPDLLAAHHFIAAEGRIHDVAAVAMLGAANNLPDNALPLLEGKRVRIFPHDDQTGQIAAVRWTNQLESVDCTVDAFRFEGLIRYDGEPVKDLNDLAMLSPESLAAEPEELSEVLPK